MLKKNDQAPDFALPDQNGHTIKLSELLKKSAVVLYFYPKDHTPGCTAQSCSFRDHYSLFKAHDAQIIGISSDSINSHKNFAQAYNLPFPILSDHKGEVAKLYGVTKKWGLFPSRVSFVIDQTGIIKYILSSQFNISSHINKTLEMVKLLQNDNIDQ